MAKAGKKHTPRRSPGNRRKASAVPDLSAVSLAVAPPVIGAPALGQVHSFDAEPVHAGVTRPGDTAPALGQVHSFDAEPVHAGVTRPGDTEAEAAARRFLYYRILRNPTAEGGDNDKTSLTLEMVRRFTIPKRRAVAIYEDCVAHTSAAAYKKRGPRGPTAGPRRRPLVR